MENLSPTLLSLFEMKHALVSGESVFTGAQRFAAKHPGPWAELLLKHCLKRGTTIEDAADLDYFHSSILDLLRRADQGEPILKPLLEFEAQLINDCNAQLQEFYTKLPFRSLLPLMLLIVPAFLILLFAPLLLLLEGLSV